MTHKVRCAKSRWKPYLGVTVAGREALGLQVACSLRYGKVNAPPSLAGIDPQRPTLAQRYQVLTVRRAAMNVKRALPTALRGASDEREIRGRSTQGDPLSNRQSDASRPFDNAQPFICNRGQPLLSSHRNRCLSYHCTSWGLFSHYTCRYDPDIFQGFLTLNNIIEEDQTQHQQAAWPVARSIRQSPG